MTAQLGTEAHHSGEFGVALELSADSFVAGIIAGCQLVSEHILTMGIGRALKFDGF